MAMYFFFTFSLRLGVREERVKVCLGLGYKEEGL